MIRFSVVREQSDIREQLPDILKREFNLRQQRQTVRGVECKPRYRLTLNSVSTNLPTSSDLVNGWSRRDAIFVSGYLAEQTTAISIHSRTCNNKWARCYAAAVVTDSINSKLGFRRNRAQNLVVVSSNESSNGHYT